MTQRTNNNAGIDRATDRPGDTSPFAVGLLTRRAHLRASTALAAVMRPYDLLHLAFRGPKWLEESSLTQTMHGRSAQPRRSLIRLANLGK